MKISSIIISNWRSIKCVEIKAQDLMIFIGQNNHGKSNILSAILFFFGEIKAQELDFNNDSKELFVEVVFTDLDDYDKSTFKKYVTSNTDIKVRKTAFSNGNFEYRGYIQNPNDESLQESNASNYTIRAIAAEQIFCDLLPETGKLTKNIIIDAQKQYVEKNKDEIEFQYQLDESNFLGLKTVAKGIFGDVYFIPAIKDSSEDFAPKDTSAFGKMYSKIIQKISDSDNDWIETKKSLSKLFGALNKNNNEGDLNNNRPQELTELETKLSKYLKNWGAEINIEVLAPNIDDIFRANTQIWIDDGVKTDIRRKGNGLQRALTFALINVISNHQKENQIDAEETKTSSRTRSNSSFFILEEPELYLHPQAQRAIFQSLVSLSESKNQVMLCTHASTLIDIDKYKSIFIVKRDNESIGTTINQCLDELFTDDAKKNFNLNYWINPDRSELFFAKKVILVEGATDKTIIPLLADKLGVFRHDYTVIDCGSKDSIPQYIKLLNSFSIPYIAVYDKDHQIKKQQPAINSADISTTNITKIIDSKLGQIICFNNDIEEELGMTAGNNSKPYVALQYVEADGFKINEKFAEKIRTIYE
ncbi:MAG: AAA family ATPase [Candidatus Kapabacteria bacterium]|jgi:predicted ATP-dependent endonuclease of OLD family|nr:AAA family ATPase [Candidatus Kapabacteria bacterium]